MKHLPSDLRTIRWPMLVAAIALDASSPVLAQSEISSGTSSATSEPIEELTVRGQRRLSRMRLEIQQAQADLYAMINAHINEPDYTITCRRQIMTGSRIAERVCVPKFMDDELTQFSQMAQRGIQLDPAAAIDYKMRMMNEAIVTAVNENPEIRAAVLEFAELKRVYAERAAREGK